MKNTILTIGFLCATYHNSFVVDDDGSEKQPNHQNKRINGETLVRELENVGQTDLMVLNNRHKLIVCERGYRAHQHQWQQQQHQRQQPQIESNTYRQRAKNNIQNQLKW